MTLYLMLKMALKSFLADQQMPYHQLLLTWTPSLEVESIIVTFHTEAPGRAGFAEQTEKMVGSWLGNLNNAARTHIVCIIVAETPEEMILCKF